MKNFTREDVMAEAYRQYGKPVCRDTLDDAMDCDTLEDAVTTILLDTAMWDSPTGNPFE